MVGGIIRETAFIFQEKVPEPVCTLEQILCLLLLSHERPAFLLSVCRMLWAFPSLDGVTSRAKDALSAAKERDACGLLVYLFFPFSPIDCGK